MFSMHCLCSKILIPMLPVSCKNLESLECHFCGIKLYEIRVTAVLEFQCGIVDILSVQSKVHETFSKCGKPLWLPVTVIQGFCKMCTLTMSTYFHVTDIPSKCSIPCTKKIVIANCSTMLVDSIYLSSWQVNNVSKATTFSIGLFNCLTSFFLTKRKTNILLMVGLNVPAAKI